MKRVGYIIPISILSAALAASALGYAQEAQDKKPEQNKGQQQKQQEHEKQNQGQQHQQGSHRRGASGQQLGNADLGADPTSNPRFQSCRPFGSAGRNRGVRHRDRRLGPRFRASLWAFCGHSSAELTT